MSEFGNYLKREPNEKLAGTLKKITWVLTAVVLITVGLMRRMKFEQFSGMFDFLPPVHAALNSLVAVFLVVAVIMVKRRNIPAHKIAINAAMACSVLFLLCYVAYHFTTPETLYSDWNKDGTVTADEKEQSGIMRPIYFLFLITHIVLAGVSLPFILYTWIYGATNQFAKHRKMAKIVFPVWLYVAITGPVCYFMLKPFY